MAGNIGILNMTQSVGSFKLAPKDLSHGHFEVKFPHLKFSVWGSDSFLIVPNMHPCTPLLSHRRPPSRTRDRRNYAGFFGCSMGETKGSVSFQCFNESRTNIILKDWLKKRQNNISHQKKTQNTFTPAPKSRKISWWNAGINRDSSLFLMHSWCVGCLIAMLTDYFDDISKKHGDLPRPFIWFSLFFSSFPSHLFATQELHRFTGAGGAH